MIDVVNRKARNKLKYPLIEIKGGLVHLYDHLTSQVQQGIRNHINNLIVLKKFSSDIERYLQFSEIVDMDYTFAGLEYSLGQNSFQFVPKINDVGEYSRAGDVIMFWPIGYKNPIKIEFFDEQIEKMYFFDPIYGRRLDQIDSVLVSRLDILDDKVEWSNISIRQIGNEARKPSSNNSEYDILTKEDLTDLQALNFDKEKFAILSFASTNSIAEQTIELGLAYPALFFSRLDLFANEVAGQISQGYTIRIETTHRDLLDSSLSKFVISNKAKQTPLTAGFINQTRKIAFYTDRELFGTIFITKEKQKKLNSSEAKKLLDYIEGEIEIGDYIVHADHGIGIYAGIAREKDQDYLQIKYAEGDELLIPFDQIHKITKYIGVSNEPPQITRLNKTNWKDVTRKARKLIGIVAKDLASHYAQIELAHANAIEINTSSAYQEFVSDFGYEETIDQKRTIDEVMNNLAQDKPMNRLIVGDVGFGKTEVAMRAAFKVVEAGLQVAVLAPTTVLAAQHYKVFSDRFRKFGIRVGMLSRFTRGDETKQNVELLSSGNLEIIIGTHRLLSSDVKFKNLGLLIIDEEQKFGVRQKEKLKKIKYGAHILAMTATPIPRTLSMALSQIQEISIISTPPQGRKAVKTEVEKFDWNKVRDAIRFEHNRGGQVYFVHNRVETINSVFAKLKDLMPGISFVIGHAQMDERKLEQVINDFYAKKYDCLICTTIIENGIDMPNVNTIIIDKSQNFGLGQLYQLRGRVGRSEKQAFAYLFYDGEQINKDKDQKTIAVGINNDHSIDSEEGKLQDDDIKVKKNTKYIERLKAIMEAGELGAGFKIASRDLEIRGAGNLLGREQHGQISKVGLALYMQMLAEEIEKAKSQSQAIT